MVKASDLRIGNLILLATFPVFPVNWINSKIVSIGSIEPKFFPENEWENKFAPVYLNKEILVDMFGFQEEGEDYTDTVVFELETNLHIRWNCKYKYLSLGYKNEIVDLHRLRHIKYIHQLQNFYYSWKGEELPIKDLKNAITLQRFIQEAQP